MVTISVCIIGKNEREYFLKECIESALRFADELIFVDTGSTDNTLEWLEEFFPQVKTFFRKWKKPQDYTGIRNFAISQAKSDYVFSLDADEVLSDDAYLIREQLEQNPDVDCWSVQGRHYLYHLGLEDASYPEHWWQNRIFKNNSQIKYPDGVMHGLPQGAKSHKKLKGIFIHHYGYTRNLVKCLKSYESNMDKLEVHTPEFMNLWLKSHLTGTYPFKQADLKQHPELIKKKFYFERLIKDD